jgi:hypothetical protein
MAHIIGAMAGKLTGIEYEVRPSSLSVLIHKGI